MQIKISKKEMDEMSNATRNVLNVIPNIGGNLPSIFVMFNKINELEGDNKPLEITKGISISSSYETKSGESSVINKIYTISYSEAGVIQMIKAMYNTQFGAVLMSFYNAFIAAQAYTETTTAALERCELFQDAPTVEKQSAEKPEVNHPTMDDINKKYEQDGEISMEDLEQACEHGPAKAAKAKKTEIE